MSESDPISLCLAGHISPPVMLARLVLLGYSNTAIRTMLRTRSGELLFFFEGRAEALDRMRTMLAAVSYEPGHGLVGIAAQFDSAVLASPEASVASYSLGDPSLLQAATAEIIGWLRAEALFAPGMDVLDLGCGFGRVAAALAPAAGSVLGLDISPRMIEEARRRCGGLPKLRFAVTPGADLAALPDSAFDLVLAVDSFPYLFQAGSCVAMSHIADSARVLRPGGSLVILNLAYGTDAQHWCQMTDMWAAEYDLAVILSGIRPFVLWDGAAFVARLTPAD